MITQPPPVAERPFGELPPRARWPWVAGVVLVLVVVALVAAAVVPVPYFLQSPGGTYPTGQHIEVRGAPTYDHGEDISFTTVSLQRATALQALVGWLDPSVDVRHERDVLGDRTQEENRELNLRQMADSKQVAAAVALGELGYDVAVVGTGAVVVGVEAGGAAEGWLERGDVVVSVDGRPVGTHVDLVGDLGARAPGDRVVLEVEPLEPPADGAPVERRTVEVVLGARPDDPSRPFLGVSLATRDLDYDLPVEVSIDSGEVGGPSAGLALTLGVIDLMTPESITGGLRVATTGTISIDGSVGPVGGVEQKTVSVRREGVELFLVPSSELEEALHYAGDMRVEAVDSVDEALAVLAEAAAAR